jgi:hypothetical protein
MVIITSFSGPSLTQYSGDALHGDVRIGVTAFPPAGRYFEVRTEQRTM